MASTYLQRTQGSATNRKKMTLSMWFKTSESGIRDYQLWETYASPSDRITMYIDSSDQIHWYDPGASVNVATNRKFRDCNGWYHIVWQIDTTESTASDRIKLYVNGSQETSFSESDYYSLNADTASGTSSYTNYIGKYGGNTNNDFNGSMSHINYVDGTAYDATAFGQYDANGVWTIKTSPSVTYGNNGFFILKNGNSVTDQSGNSNNFTVAGGTLTNTEDNPSNVFTTLNPLWKDTVSAGAITYSNGNTSFYPNTDGNSYTRSTLGASSGKYYIELKATEVNTGQSTSMNIVPSDAYGAGTGFAGTYGFAIQLNSTNTKLQKEVDGSNTTINSSFSSGSIAMMAVDLDNGKMWIGYNGTWYNNNNPSSTLDVNNPDITGINTSIDYLIGFRGYMQGSYPSGYYNQVNVNFGNGYFGTTAVSSAGTNASGNGIFEFDVPTGYTALSTKGLNL